MWTECLLWFMYVAAAKFTGSGGAVVVFCPQGESQAQRLQERCSKEGFVMVKVAIGPSNDDDVV